MLLAFAYVGSPPRRKRPRPPTAAERLAADCRKQYEFVRAQGWLPHFEEASRLTGLPVETLLAVGSRESNLRNVLGDHGNGRGVMQVDARWHADFVERGGADDPHRNILYGARHLADLRNQIRLMEGRTNTLSGPSGVPRTFVGAPMTERQLLDVAVAAYNCGLNAYYHFSTAGDPDRGTTPGPYAPTDASGRRRGDYAQDVRTRALQFASIRGGSPWSAGL